MSALLRLANICVVKIRREPHRRQAFIKAFGQRRGLVIEELPVDHDAIVPLAIETRVTAYDASCLWLALELNAELVTLDDALSKAWANRDGRL